ncbi:MAG TPA: LytTR family DNA-binding domain-containing protein [Bacteroidales bacterium]|nr:LytTR family DNA-binding domain-containing protein [Bacteroidales bacterium]HRZ20115.1 LytTR family DNA-binding domain-containing protein [Bacteroidales bacterium]
MSSRMRCIIVDDEPLSREILEKYISETPFLGLEGSCSDAFEALEAIRGGSIDLIFLDINMPRLSGIELMKIMEHPPLVIFTTAYPEYALEGFELDVVDYLVKPFGYERFLKAVNKALDRLQVKLDPRAFMSDYIVVKSEKKIYKVNFDSIRFIQSVGDYLRLVTDRQVIIVHDTMKNMATLLPGDQFIRIHKSYLVNLMHIMYIDGNQVNMGQEKLPVGATYKEDLLKRLSEDTPLRG